jgi:hypothetical protein
MDDTKKRNPMLYVAVGKKGGGKTYTTINKIIMPYCYNTNHPKRVLILDVNGEYSQFKTISLDNIEKFSAHPIKEARRIVPPVGMSLDDIANMLIVILKRFREGLLLIEDINAYLSDSIPADVIGTIVRLRHKAVDVVVHYQGIGRAGQPKVLSNTNVLRIHKTNDDAERHKNKFEDQYEIVKIAQTIVNKDFNKANMEGVNNLNLGTWVDLGGGEMEYKSCYTYVNFDKNNISGNFTDINFFDALDEYIFTNENSVLKPYLSKKNRDGSLTYNYGQAMDLCKINLFQTYYGNPNKSDVLKKYKINQSL